MKQWVVVEMSVQRADPVAWGPFDNQHLADTFAEALRTFPGHSGQVVVLELNKEGV